jgi:hypothetical protein
VPQLVTHARGQRRLLPVALALLMTGAFSASSSTAAAEPEIVPPVAGATTVVFDGTSAIRLQVPAAATLRREDVTVEFSGGTAAFGFLGPLDAPCQVGFENQDGAPPPDAWCTDYAVTVMKGWTLSPFVSAPPEERLPAGRLDFHVVTDGTLTVTLRIGELPGTVRYQASGMIDGSVRETPVTCAAASARGCSKQGYGGQTFDDVPAMSIVGSAAFGQRPNNLAATNDPSPGTASAGSCIYPNFYNPNKSPEVAAHPYGCDADEAGPATWQGRYFITGAANPLLTSIATLRTDLRLERTPRIYTGFVGHQVEGAESIDGQPGRYGGYSYWMNRKITCPTKNFTGC